MTPTTHSTPFDSPASGQARNSAILITGAGGEVGHGLINAIHAAGRQNIVALDIRKLDRDMRSKCMDTFIGDICDAALLGRIPTVEEYFRLFNQSISGHEGETYRYLCFDQMPAWRRTSR